MKEKLDLPCLVATCTVYAWYTSTLRWHSISGFYTVDSALADDGLEAILIFGYRSIISTKTIYAALLNMKIEKSYAERIYNYSEKDKIFRTSEMYFN